MRLYYIIFFVLSSINLLHAQSTLEGRIVDEKQKGISDVTIRLLQKDSTFIKGVITDSIGNYNMQNIKKGNYLLYISSIGYNSQEIQLNIETSYIKLDPIKLLDSNMTLKEVVIKGKSFIRQNDRVLILPDKQQIKHAATGYDLLYNLMIPGISVDRRKGQVSTFNGEVSLYINGRKADYREIQALRPHDIEKVEYFDMPTGQYAGDKAAINYIIKERKTGGYVTLDGTQTIGHLNGDYNATAKLNHQNTNYTLFGGHSMSKYDGIQSEKKEVFHFPQSEISRTTGIDEALTKKNNQYVQLNIDNTNNKRTLNGKLSFFHSKAPDNYNQTLKTYSNEPSTPIQTLNETNQQSIMPGLNLYGNFNLTPKQNLQVTLLGTYTKNDYERSYREADYRSYTQAQEDLYNIRFKTNYNVKLKHQNSFGLQLSHLHQISSSNYSGDYNQWTHLWTGETLLMGQYNQNLGKKVFLSIQFGGDLLQYRLHGYDQKKYLSPHANIMLNYRISSNQSIMYALNTGNSNPPLDWLSDVDQNIDSLQIKRGNPYLDKANYYITYLVYSLQAGKFNFQVTGYYLGATPSPAYDYYIEGNKLVTGFRSDGNYHNIKSALAVTYKVNSNLRINASGFYRYYKATGKIKADQSEWAGSVDVNYFWKDFAFNVYGKSTARSVSMSPSYTRSPASYGASLRWNHKNWNVEIGTDNPFSKHNRNIEYLNTDVYQFYNTTYSRIYQQTGYIKLAYTFDFGRKTSRTQDKVDMNINSGILKAE